MMFSNSPTMGCRRTLEPPLLPFVGGGGGFSLISHIALVARTRLPHSLGSDYRIAIG